MNAETGTSLDAIRDAAGMTRRQVAERMSANQVRVSRIEAGDGDNTDVASFLEALGTPRARSFAHLWGPIVGTVYLSLTIR